MVRTPRIESEVLRDGREIHVARAKSMQDSVVVRIDPRAMSRMDPETRLVHAMLEQWGKETREAQENGFPVVTVLGRVIEQGPGAGQAGRGVSTLSPQSARVDACVSRLWKRAQLCVRRYYQNWEAPEVMARREKVSTTQFREILRRARFLVGSWLAEMPEI